MRPIDIPAAVDAMQQHATAVMHGRQIRGLPTCGDTVSDLRKLSALMEEVGEVARCIQDDVTVDVMRRELLDVATAATLWAWALERRAP